MSNRLPILAADIRSAHSEALAAANTAAERAIAAGNMLVEAKALVKHGQWLPFLKEAGIPERTAQRYMTLADARLNSDTVSLLGGVVPALRFVRLRTLATGQFDRAEAAAIRQAQGGDVEDDDLLVSLETAMMLMDEMVAMFPPDERKGGDA